MNGATNDVSKVMATLLRRWKTIAACMIAVMAIAYGYTMVASPVYQATAKVNYSPPPQGSFNVLPTGQVNENLQTLVQGAQAPSVLATAAKIAGVDQAQFEGATSVQQQGASSTMGFTAKASTAAQASRLANAYANAFVENRLGYVKAKIDPAIAAVSAQLDGMGKMRINDPANEARTLIMGKLADLRLQQRQTLQAFELNAAEAPSVPAWPNTMLVLFAALFVGLGLGCGVALLTASMNHKLTIEHIDLLPAPALVKVPVAHHAPKAMPLGPSAAEALVGDAFAALGARVMLDKREGGAHVVLVTSARSGEGKSSVAANLASALAQGGRRVVLVDADMRRPTQELLFPALQGRPGLSQVLLGQVDVEHALTLVAPNLAAVASGPKQPNASVLLASVAFRALVDRLSHISEAIVIDAPPVLAVNDALAIAPAANQTLICARMGTSIVGEVSDAYAKIAAASSTPQAMVLVGTERPTGYGYDTDTGPRVTAYPGPRIALPGAPGATVAGTVVDGGVTFEGSTGGASEGAA